MKKAYSILLFNLFKTDMSLFLSVSKLPVIVSDCEICLLLDINPIL